MTFELVGNKKKVKKFYHLKPCYDSHLADKAFKQKESEELDDLVKVIMKIYGVKELPTQAYTLLQKLRNGERVFGKRQNIGKRYKQGYSYPLIAETFDHIEETIYYWNERKDFEGFMGAFKYALTIVIDKIYFVEKRKQEREQKQKMIDEHVKEVEHLDEFESGFKKKTSNKSDITEFLDD